MENNRSSVKNALLHGDLFTKLSAVLMGIGMIGHKQVIKGCLVFLFEIAFIYYMLSTGIHSLAMMPSLGDRAQSGMKLNRSTNISQAITPSRSFWLE